MKKTTIRIGSLVALNGTLGEVRELHGNGWATVKFYGHELCEVLIEQLSVRAA